MEMRASRDEVPLTPYQLLNCSMQRGIPTELVSILRRHALDRLPPIFDGLNHILWQWSFLEV